MNDDHDYIEFDDMISTVMEWLFWMIFAIVILTVAGLIAWGIHAAIAGAGAMPAHCATLECAVAGGL